MGMALPAGGHLTHGWNVSITGKYFQQRCSTACARDDQPHRPRPGARAGPQQRPKLIFCGGTAYPRTIDFAAFARDRRRGRARSWSRTSRTSPGSSRGGAHPSPVGHADVVTTTTHKTLRGPRGAHDHVHRPSTRRASTRPSSRACRAARTTTPPRPSPSRCTRRPSPSSRSYARQIVENAQALAEALAERGFDLVSGGTDNHLILIDLTRQGHHRQARRPGARPGRHRRPTTTPSRSTRASRSTRRASASARRRSPPAACARRR